MSVCLGVNNATTANLRTTPRFIPTILEAETAWRHSVRTVIRTKPMDMTGRGNLAAVLTGPHRDQDAVPVHESILSMADALDSLGLIDTDVYVPASKGQNAQRALVPTRRSVAITPSRGHGGRPAAP